jgi:DNA-binding transcriptional LysR family regulator
VFGASLDNTTWRLDGPRPPGRSDVQVRGRVAVDSARAALRGALIGLGIALLPAALARDELEDGRLQQVLTRYGVEGGGLYLVYPSNRHPSAALRAFVDFFEPRVR